MNESILDQSVIPSYLQYIQDQFEFHQIARNGGLSQLKYQIEHKKLTITLLAFQLQIVFQVVDRKGRLKLSFQNADKIEYGSLQSKVLEDHLNYHAEQSNQHLLEIIDTDIHFQADVKKIHFETQKKNNLDFEKVANPCFGGLPFVELIMVNCIMSYLEHRIMEYGTLSKENCIARETLLQR